MWRRWLERRAVRRAKRFLEDNPASHELLGRIQNGKLATVSRAGYEPGGAVIVKHATRAAVRTEAGA
jgi:hypothetical protein